MMKQETIFSFFSSSAAAVGQSNSTALMNPMPDVFPAAAVAPAIGPDPNKQPFGKALAIIIFVFFFFRVFSIFSRLHRHPFPYLAVLALLRQRWRMNHMVMNHHDDHFNNGRHLQEPRVQDQGVEAAVMETFPVLRYADVRKLMEKNMLRETGGCAICLCEFEGERSLLRLLVKCDHVFHVGCIDRWLACHVTCPVCRAVLTADPDDDDKVDR